MRSVSNYEQIEQMLRFPLENLDFKYMLGCGYLNNQTLGTESLMGRNVTKRLLYAGGGTQSEH